VTEDERLQDIVIADVRRIMNKREGRRFMWRLLGFSGVFEVPEPGDVGRVNFENGRKVIGTTLLMEIMQSCPEQWTTMQTEAVQDALVSQQRKALEQNDRRDHDDRD
jgi:hypothetical protein